jgi:hypothetical protein
MGNKRTIKMRGIKLLSWVVATLLNLTFLLSPSTAQVAILAAGCNASGSGGTVSYSVGQVVYQFHSGTNGSLSEGVQQSYKITKVATIKVDKSIYLTVTAYPNPATDFLILKVENFDDENMSYQVVDMPGKVLLNQKITGNQTKIAMGNLLSATYFVKVMLNNKAVKTFKIIKN